MATQPTDPGPRRARPATGSVAGGGHATLADRVDLPSPDYAQRALLLWPGLDRARLASAHGDPERIARLVARRTPLPAETILRMLGVRTSLDPIIVRAPEDDDPGPS